MKIAKYFWELNPRALRETKKILKDPEHPQFNVKAVALFSRCDQPKELFSILGKQNFLRAWPKVSAYWRRVERTSEFRNWWQTIYEQMLVGSRPSAKKPKGAAPQCLKSIGKLIRENRIKHGLSQKTLALKVGMKQPDISNIEEGKVNITMATLGYLCKALDIKQVNIVI